jgi:transposase
LYQRVGIETLHEHGVTIKEIQKEVGCSTPTVYHWLQHYKTDKNFEDDAREGNKK